MPHRQYPSESRMIFILQRSKSHVEENLRKELIGRVVEYINHYEKLPVAHDECISRLYYKVCRHRGEWATILAIAVEKSEYRDSDVLRKQVRSRYKKNLSVREKCVAELVKFIQKNRKLPSAMEQSSLYNSIRLSYNRDYSFHDVLIEAVMKLPSGGLKPLMEKELERRKVSYNTREWKFGLAQARYYVVEFIQEHSKLPTSRDLTFVLSQIASITTWNEFLQSSILLVRQGELRMELIRQLRRRLKSKIDWRNDGRETIVERIQEFILGYKRLPIYSDMHTEFSYMSRYKKEWGVSSQFVLIKEALDGLENQLDDTILSQLHLQNEEKWEKYGKG